MKNVIFDLGGVVFSRDKKLCSSDLIAFWKIIHATPTPNFWLEFDRGTLTWEEMVLTMTEVMQMPYNHCDEILKEAIAQTRPVAATGELIGQLKKAGYKLFVLSNMSFEFIADFRKYPILNEFDGEVISCYHNLIKPERAIYELISNKFGLNPVETLFIDDKPVNTVAAADFGFNVFNFDRENPEKACDKLRKILI
ncbi:MAG: HAD family phosphatase [Salinivirgaceae bacterium]|nr:HAD family phosphatase [Salinivirgaceae bacterium]